METLYGMNLVTEALRAGRRTVHQVRIARERDDGRVRRLLELAAKRGVPVARPERRSLDREADENQNQGVVARAEPLPVADAADLLDSCGERPLLVVLDGVEDPRNLGAILRSAAAAGVDALLTTERRSAPLGPVAARVSAGGSEWVPVGRCTNVVPLLKRLQQSGVWTVGLDADGEQDWADFDYRTGTALVVGAEGKGLRPLVRRTLDATVRIPMQGGLESLNVGVAAAVVLFEAVRQRRKPGKSLAEGKSFC